MLSSSKQKYKYLFFKIILFRNCEKYTVLLKQAAFAQFAKRYLGDYVVFIDSEFKQIIYNHYAPKGGQICIFWEENELNDSSDQQTDTCKEALYRTVVNYYS